MVNLVIDLHGKFCTAVVAGESPLKVVTFLQTRPDGRVIVNTIVDMVKDQYELINLNSFSDGESRIRHIMLFRQHADYLLKTQLLS